MNVKLHLSIKLKWCLKLMDQTPYVCIRKGSARLLIEQGCVAFTKSRSLFSFLPMACIPLQLTDFRSAFTFELAARQSGGIFGGESVTFQVNVVDPFNSITW